MKSFIKSIFILSFVSFFTTEPVQAMQRPKKQSGKLKFEKKLPQSLISDLRNISCAIESIPHFLTYKDFDHEFNNTLLHLLIFFYIHQDTPVQNRISEYIVYGITSILDNHKELDQALAPSTFGDDFIALATSRGLSNLAIEILKLLKSIMEIEDFDTYLKNILKQITIPLTDFQQAAFFMLNQEPDPRPEGEIVESPHTQAAIFSPNRSLDNSEETDFGIKCPFETAYPSEQFAAQTLPAAETKPLRGHNPYAVKVFGKPTYPAYQDSSTNNVFFLRDDMPTSWDDTPTFWQKNESEWINTYYKLTTHNGCFYAYLERYNRYILVQRTPYLDIPIEETPYF